MKKWIWVFPAVTLLALAVVPFTAQAQAVILQLTVPVFAEDFMADVITEFETQNPGIQVQLIPVAGNGMPVDDSDDAEAYQDNLTEYFSSADVLIVDSDLNAEATRAGYVLNMMPLTNSDFDFNPSDFYDVLLRSFEWDGGQWALPISTNFIVMSYIPQAFDDAGLNYPSQSWTLDDLDYAARTLAEYGADGSVTLPGMVVLGGGGGGNNLPALFMSLLGEGVYDASSFPNDPDFSSSQLETLLDTWLALQTDGIISIPQGINTNEVPLIIGTQQGGGGFGGPGGNQNTVERVTTLLPGTGAGLDVTGYAISEGTSHPEEAYQLVKFLISNPTVITFSGGATPALTYAEASTDVFGGGPGGGGFPGGFNATTLSDELIAAALSSAMPASESRFAEGITDALSLMQTDSLDARSALDEAQSTLLDRLAAADARATTPITVQAPEIQAPLQSGEVALNFAVLAQGGGGRGGQGQLALQEQWETVAAQFAQEDAEVGYVTIGTENQNQLADVAATYDCFYASTNLVPDADLTVLLSLSPMVSIDPNYDPNDFVSGALDQVSLDGQIWAYPMHISPLLLRFDYDLFNLAGVPIPNENWTVAEFEDAIRNLMFVMDEDQSPVVLNASSESALMALIAAYGGLPVDTRTNPATLNFADPATVTAIQQVLDLVKAGYVTYGGPGGPGGGGGVNDVALYSNTLNAFSFGGFGGGPGGPGGANANVPNTDGYITFPRGQQMNVVSFDLGTAYISATTENVDACYRFITYLSDTKDLFQSMPVRYSQINDPDLAAAKGEQTIAFFNALADLMAEPSTLLFGTNVNAGNFGVTNWLFEAFESYIAGESLDFEADLQDAQQKTEEFMTCVAATQTEAGTQPGQEFFQQIQACQTAVDGA